MPSSSTQSESTDFKPWNSPHLLTNQFQLLAKLIEAVNANTPPENDDVTGEMLKELELKIINVFNHKMMQSWLALAKSYYPYYKENDDDKSLIEALEEKLNIKTRDYESLSILVNDVFLTKYPNVNNQYQLFIDNIKKIMAKLTAVALSTPALINDAHQRDKKKFEEAGPCMSSCISPLETILRHMMTRGEVDKSFIIAATSLLLQVKAIKSHFEQLTLIQQLEHFTRENKSLQKELKKLKLEMQHINSVQKLEKEQSKVPPGWQFTEEQIALVVLFKLQKKINQYYKHLTDGLAQSPQDRKIDTKLQCIIVMKNELDKNNVPPNQKIKTFKKQLHEVKEQLKEHRDPIWIRFLRDCLRTLTLTLLGVAIDRKLNYQHASFFKPSHGQILVQETNSIITLHQGISIQL